MKLYRVSLDKTGSICQGTYSVEGFDKVPDMLGAIVKAQEKLNHNVNEMKLHTENGEVILENFAQAAKLLENMGKTDSVGEDSLFLSGLLGGERVVIEFPLKPNKFLSISAKTRRMVILVEKELCTVFEK